MNRPLSELEPIKMREQLLLRDLPSEFETPRLICRIPGPGDGMCVYEAVKSSLPELRAVLAAVPWAADEPSVELSESFCGGGFAAFHARNDFPFLIFERDGHRLVGACGLHRPDWQVPRLEIGYWCRTDAAGNGYVTEAVQGLMEYGREQLGALRLEIIVDAPNARSRRVAERAGFQLEGTLRAHRRGPHGELRDLCVYASVVDEASRTMSKPAKPEPSESIEWGRFEVRAGTLDDAPAISKIVQAGFLQYVAPDWELPAQEDFLRDTTAEKLRGPLAEATYVAVCEQDGEVLGVIAMPRPNLVQLLFVAPDHLHKGIGTALWASARTAIEDRFPEVKTVELNSSPYALTAYKALGFFPISEPFRRRGAVTTRMACWLPGRTLELASGRADQ